MKQISLLSITSSAVCHIYREYVIGMVLFVRSAVERAISACGAQIGQRNSTVHWVGTASAAGVECLNVWLTDAGEGRVERRPRNWSDVAPRHLNAMRRDVQTHSARWWSGALNALLCCRGRFATPSRLCVSCLVVSSRLVSSPTSYRVLCYKIGATK